MPVAETYNETAVVAEAGSNPTDSEAVIAPPNSSDPERNVLRHFFGLIVT